MLLRAVISAEKGFVISAYARLYEDVTTVPTKNAANIIPTTITFFNLHITPSVGKQAIDKRVIFSFLLVP